MHPNVVSLIGRRFGRLEVLDLSPREKTPSGNALWLCLCDCGELCDSIKYDLERGLRKSCGCYRAERVTTHGESGTNLYRVWHQMRRRCEDTQNKDFKFYGARGVRVCAAWKEYAPFAEWARASGYAPGLTLDREKSTGNYSPGNCRWITIREQQLNKRNSVRVQLGNKLVPFETALNLVENQLPAGVTRSTVRARVHGYKWSFDKATTTPLNSTKGFATTKRKDES